MSGRREHICDFSIFVGLQPAQQPAVIPLIISEHRVLCSVSRVNLGAALFWLIECGNCRGPALPVLPETGVRPQSSFHLQHRASVQQIVFCFFRFSVPFFLTRHHISCSDYYLDFLHSISNRVGSGLNPVMDCIFLLKVESLVARTHFQKVRI